MAKKLEDTNKQTEPINNNSTDGWKTYNNNNEITSTNTVFKDVPQSVIDMLGFEHLETEKHYKKLKTPNNLKRQKINSKTITLKATPTTAEIPSKITTMPAYKTHLKKTTNKTPDNNFYNTGHRQRLRERFLKGGKDSVANYELLEIILFASNPRSDVKNIAKYLLHEFGSISNIIKADAADLARIKGIKNSGICAIKAVDALAQLMLIEDVRKQPILNSYQALNQYCRVSMRGYKVEILKALFLNHKRYLILDEDMQKGTIDQTPIFPREIAKRALELGAKFVVISHNHPSGNANPSENDLRSTYNVQHSLACLGIKLEDHLIVGSLGKVFSFREKGLL